MSERLNSKLDFLPEQWYKKLNEEFQKEYMDNIRNILKEEYKKVKIYPPKDKIFNALKLLDYHKVKVVILGQDPYHGFGQANGLSFAVGENIKNPPSLENIFQEIENDTKMGKPKSSELIGWARQGVLLLNACLTVRESEPNSHKNIGWEIFTDKVIYLLNNSENPIVFFLWGKYAQKKEEFITNEKHLILKAAHPSPFSVHKGFFGCSHFSKANNFLKSKGIEGINWQMS